ncbi:tsukushin-like [Nylanderia fulva]|uniref:tsukushin-like n=1 Tax=Nylanderia fulva TaxID=613905 RepID=UPI0010FB96A7|nr:tsukushin-like [Nylanderia fulva]XP_029160136.1 tsukushin-like [Nylanderia fulva]
MSIFLMNRFFLLCFVVATVQDVLVLGSPQAAKIMDQNPLPTMCTYSKTNSILKARCSKLKSNEIPLDLKTDIQVLDIIGNHLIELKNDSLHPYKKLIFIYLRNNWIINIEETVFANQPYLQMLDLSFNYIFNLPKSLFQLPYLRTLYLDHNRLTDIVFKMKVTSPLRLLQLSKNSLHVIPNIGVQPTLLNLNVSDNFITWVSTENLAPFCSLKVLDMTGNKIRFNEGSCDCQAFNAWVKLRQIKIKPDLYKCTDSPAMHKACANVRFSNRTYELFNECLAMIQQKIKTEKPRSVWIHVASCISVYLIVVLVALFCVYKRYCKRRRRH